MALTITDDMITSGRCSAVATWRPHAAVGGEGAWVASQCARLLLTKSQAITACLLAEAEAAGNGDSLHAAARRAELGLPVPLGPEDGSRCRISPRAARSGHPDGPRLAWAAGDGPDPVRSNSLRFAPLVSGCGAVNVQLN